MQVFEWILFILMLAVIFTAIARRIGAPYPVFLAILGVGLACVPGAPRLIIDPNLVLVVFLAPVIVDAAYSTSLRELRKEWLMLLGLVVGCVVFTTVTVAFVVHEIFPAMPWAAAILLGAIVAPPDAVAASTVLEQLKLPRRIRTILEGESLLNDASSLVIFNGALLAWSSHGSNSFGFLWLMASAPISLLFGSLAGFGMIQVMQLPFGVGSRIIIQFISAFALWLIAERFFLSGVLTLVAFALVVSKRAPAHVSAKFRLISRSVWRTTVFLLNVLAFVIIGLSLGPILDALNHTQIILYFKTALAVLGTVIVARFIWVFAFGFGANYMQRDHIAKIEDPALRPSPRTDLVISWSGMRGMVTLAAALALPSAAPGVEGFPYRELIIVCAFSVVLGTLVLQGLTLGPLLRKLELPKHDFTQEEAHFARTEMVEAALDSLSKQESAEAHALSAEYASEARYLKNDVESDLEAIREEKRVRRIALTASRQRLFELRNMAVIGEEAFHQVQHDLDAQEVAALKSKDF